MKYKETENWILNKLPFYQSQGFKAYKPGIDNIKTFVRKCNINHQRLKFIHVGGTNGKGSTCLYLSSILQEAGYKVGIFTSPHYFDYRERIKINNKLIKKKFIQSFINEYKDSIEEIRLSFFEVSFAMALSYFESKKVDYAIIEVGLGGRLDATNIILPEISVITNISYDHMHILGDTLEKIAVEKAGIIKEKTNVIIGERSLETEKIFIKAAKEKSSNIFFASDFPQKRLYSKVEYQNKNINTAINVLKLLKIARINSNNIKKGIKNIYQNTGFFGRWTLIEKNPKIIYDSAHNESGFENISIELKKEKYNNLIILISLVAGKNVKKLISHLPKNSKIFFTKLNMERAMDYSELKKNNLENLNYDENPKRLFSKLKKQVTKNDLILITGSNFLAKEIFL